MLTREHILGLDAGHELNCLIAEHIFQTQPCPPGINGGCRRTGGLDWDEIDPIQYAEPHEWGPRLRNLRNFSGHLPHAFDVYNHFWQAGYHVQILTIGTGLVGVTIVEPSTSDSVLAPWPKRYEAAIDTLEVAMCHAALLAKFKLPAPASTVQETTPKS